MRGAKRRLASVADICVVTSYPAGWHELAKITNETKARYCRRWGYDFYADRSDVYQNGLSIKGFIKFDLMLHALLNAKEKYEAVVWIDADALITNPEIRLEDLLDRFPDKGIVTGYDHNGHHTTVIMARNTQTVKEYLWACNNTGRPLFMQHPWHEMEAMRYFAQTPPYNNLLGYLSIKEICGILVEEYQQYGNPDWLAQQYAWKPKDFILHLSALSLPRRIQLATFYANPANHELAMPRALTNEQIAHLNNLRAEMTEQELQPIVDEMEGRNRAAGL